MCSWRSPSHPTTPGVPQKSVLWKRFPWWLFVIGGYFVGWYSNRQYDWRALRSRRVVYGSLPENWEKLELLNFCCLVTTHPVNLDHDDFVWSPGCPLNPDATRFLHGLLSDQADVSMVLHSLLNPGPISQICVSTCIRIDYAYNSLGYIRLFFQALGQVVSNKSRTQDQQATKRVQLADTNKKHAKAWAM